MSRAHEIDGKALDLHGLEGSSCLFDGLSGYGEELVKLGQHGGGWRIGQVDGSLGKVMDLVIQVQ